jgi:hypothetical protein
LFVTLLCDFSFGIFVLRAKRRRNCTPAHGWRQADILTCYEQTYAGF